MNYQEKGRIPKGSSFTPVFDHLVDEIGLIKTAIIGVIWRYSQMADKVCRASQKSIAKRLNLSRQTLNKHLSELIDLGYIQDLTPTLRNKPHLYLLTNRAFEKIFEKERRIKSGTILTKNEVAIIKNNPGLSIFEIFGVNNFYLKKDIVKKEINNKEVERDDIKIYPCRNLSNNPFIDLMVFDEFSDLTKVDPFSIINGEDPFYRIVNFFHFGFLWNIFTFEMDLSDEVGHSFSRTLYQVTKMGVDYLKICLNNDSESFDMDKMAEILDFWFWYSLEGNARVEDIEMMFSIYENNQLPVYEINFPEVYRRSRDVRVLSRIIGKEPPEKLFPKIYKTFEVMNPLHEIDHLKSLYNDWIEKGNNKNDLTWFFECYQDY